MKRKRVGGGFPFVYGEIPSKDERVLVFRTIGLGDPSIAIGTLPIDLLHIDAAIRKDGIL